ncbi:energy transducer TonB [Kordiimonas aestuarii]|uniref:energy transducer TonB n=1 Tax=Kordiimonas aestuarii TaxID=1005925 RepID=UPI0021CFC7F0|nr:TonB family protein [Kordiimonas aestuarii]
MKLSAYLLAFVGLVFISATSNTAVADAMQDWQREVVQKVAAKQGYPRMAVARQLEGSAKVRLTVAADGTISTFEIVEATGEDVLDKAIPKLMDRLNPLPPLPSGQNELSFVLPLTWSLD